MKNKLTPEIRFPVFSGDWEECKLRELCDEFKSGKNIKAEDISVEGNYPVLGGNGLRGYTKTYNHDGVYALIGRQGALCGNMNISYGKAYFTEHAIAVKGNKNNDTKFLFYLLGKMNLGQYSDQSAQPGLAVNKLLELAPFIPVLEEQSQISIFLKKIDDSIVLHQQELTTLKQTKQGFLQKMFPKEGETVPQIRFSGFTCDWEQRKLREMLAEPVTDGPHETPKLEESGIPFISVDAIVDNKIDFDRKRGYISEETDELYSKKYRPQYHDVFLVKSGSTVGKTAIVETKKRFNIWSPLAAMRVGEVSDPYFLYFLLQTRKMQNQVKDKASSGTQPNLGMRELEKFHTQITPNLEEQKKIGAFFQQLDNLITLYQRELDVLKETKKAFLQKMFV